MYQTYPVRMLILALLCLAVHRPTQSADVPSAAELEALGLEIRWNSQAIIDVSRDIVAHVSNDEDNIYVQSSAGVLTTFNAENGRRLWTVQTGRSDEPAMPAVSNKNIVIVAAGPMVYGYNKFSGMPVIRFRMARQPSAAPVMGEGIFYAPLSGGALYAYSTSVLEHKFRYGTLPDTVAVPHLWRFICNEEIIQPPVLGQEAVAFASEAGNLHSVNTTGIARGRSRFQMTLKNAATAPLALADNETSSSIMMLTGDDRVFSVDLIKGSVEWTYPVGRHMTTAPIVIRNDVYVVSDNGTLLKFSRDERSPNWGRPIEVPQIRAPMFIGAGMEEVAVDPQLQSDLDTGEQAVRITTVSSRSPAAMAGLQAGDIVTSIDGVPTVSVDITREILLGLPLRVERPMDVIRVSTGMQLASVRLDPPLVTSTGQSVTSGVLVTAVARDSVAANAGIQPDDLLIKVNDGDINDVETALSTIAAAAPGTVGIQVLRDGGTVDAEFLLDAARRSPLNPGEPTVSLKPLKLRIPVNSWDVGGIRSLSAVGRFSVFGVDQSNRLVAFNTRTSEMLGRVSVQEFGVHVPNSLTDQVYLVSSTGDVLCLREIGPTVRLPDLSPLSGQATVKNVTVTVDDPIEPTGTVVCQVELPDGTVQDITADTKGVVRKVYVEAGQVVSVNDPLILIADDQFATYHQRPEQQPIDVELKDENPANTLP